MYTLSLCTGSLLVLAVSAAAGDLYQYYQPPLEHSGPLEGADSYPVYLRPVLVGKTAPLDVMYLALDGKDLYLYPSALHLVPYPLHRQQAPQADVEKLYHHVENPQEYNNDDEENYGEEDHPLDRSATNSTEVPATPRSSLANQQREPTAKQETKRI